MKLLLGFTTSTASIYATAQGWTFTGYDNSGHPRYSTSSGEPVVFSQGAFAGEVAGFIGQTPSEVIYGPIPVENFVNTVAQASTTTKLTVAAIPGAVASTSAVRIMPPTPPNLTSR